MPCLIANRGIASPIPIFPSPLEPNRTMAHLMGDLSPLNVPAALMTAGQLDHEAERAECNRKL